MLGSSSATSGPSTEELSQSGSCEERLPNPCMSSLEIRALRTEIEALRLRVQVLEEEAASRKEKEG